MCFSVVEKRFDISGFFCPIFFPRIHTSISGSKPSKPDLHSVFHDVHKPKGFWGKAFSSAQDTQTELLYAHSLMESLSDKKKGLSGYTASK